MEYDLLCFDLKTKSDIAKYNGYLKNFNGYDAFYKIELFNVINTEFEQLKYYVLTKNNQVLILMPFTLRKIIIQHKDTGYYDVSSFYGYSGPLYKEDIKDKDLQCFWRFVDSWYNKNNIISEFIRFNLEGNYKNYSGILTPTLNNVKGEILTDEKSQWDSFASKVRNNYRKAVANGLKAQFFHANITESTIKIFYSVYIGTMERNKAENNYFFSLDYFKNLILANPNSNVLIIIFKDDVPISAELILLNKNSMYSFLGGTKADFFHLRPNDFLKLEALKWGRAHGYTHYILGGGRVNDDSLYKYKKSFFPKTNDLVYYTGRKIINKGIYEKLVTLNLNYNYKITEETVTNIFFPLYRKQQTTLKVIKEKKAWTTIINQIGNYDFYHTYDYHMLSRKENEDPVLLIYSNSNDEVCIAFPLMIRKIEDTLYFDASSVYGYGGPLICEKVSENDFITFQTQLQSYFQKERIISVFSRLHPYLPNQENAIQNLGAAKTLGKVVNINLRLTDEEQVAQYSKSTKQYLRKLKKTHSIEIRNDMDAISTFISIYEENMKRVNAQEEYFFPRSYYTSFVNATDFKTEFVFAISNDTKEVISGAMFIYTNHIIQYHLSGTSTEHLNLNAIRLILDNVRTRANTSNIFKVFNLGGGLGGQTDSLFNFKSYFSKDFKDFKIWNYIADNKIYKSLSNSNLDLNINKDEKINFFPLYRYKKKE